MKKLFRFIPLAIAISSAIIYLFNIISFRVINNGTAMYGILQQLKVYLYISIMFFIIYFIVFFVEYFMKNKKKNNIEKVTKEIITERPVVKEVIITGNKYCPFCGEKIFNDDKYCKNCGKSQYNTKSGIPAFLKNIINVLELVILILILYFSVVMLFDYKEQTDPNFKSPLNVSVTK